MRKLSARRDAPECCGQELPADGAGRDDPPTDLTHVFEVTDRVWMERIEPYDVHLSRDGRVMEVLSEHLCQGWLEGYLLTGRHGLFSCYEAFIHIVDSMVNQHAKWLKTSGELAWRKPIASLNYLLTSHVWRQDHNGFSHQDPGFADFVANKKADTVQALFPAGCQHAALDHRSLPENLQPHQRHHRRQAAGAAMADGRGGRSALPRGRRHLGMGRHGCERRRRAGCGDGLRRRRADAGDARCHRHSALGTSGPEDSRRQRRRPDDAAVEYRAPAWPRR